MNAVIADYNDYDSLVNAFEGVSKLLLVSSTEKSILESGLHYTILKNNLYLDLLPAFVGENVFDNNTIYVPAGDGKISAVLRSEMAEAAAQILISDGHENKIYDFVNEQSVGYKEIAEFLGKISRKSIQYFSPSLEEYMATLTGFGLPKEMIHIFTAFAVAQAQGELDKTSNDLTTILGRKPTSVLQRIESVYSRG